MSALVGLFRPASLTQIDRAAVLERSRTLDYAGACRDELWSDEFLCLARTYHQHETSVSKALDTTRQTLLVFDGDLLDFEEQRRRLADGRCISSSDTTEAGLCLKLHEAHGPAAFARLNGHFTILIYIMPAKQLLLINDRFCSRPLYYHIGPGSLAFGTQPRALLLPHVPRQLDLSAVRQFFVFQTVLDEASLIKDVRALPPASVLDYRPSALRITQYWTRTYRSEPEHPKVHYAEDLAGALTEAIRRGLRGAKNTAILLSGGLDARAIVARAPTPLSCITVADFDNTEVRIARSIAAHCGLPFTFIQRTPDHYIDQVDIGAELGDGAYRFEHAHFANLRHVIPQGIHGLATGYGFDLLLKGAALPRRRLRLRGWPLNRHVLLPIATGTSDSDLVNLLLETLPESGWNGGGIARAFRQDQRGPLEDDVREVLNKMVRSSSAHADTLHQRYEYVAMYMMAKGFKAFLNLLSIRNFFREYTVAFDNIILDQHLRLPPSLRVDGLAFRTALRIMSPQLARVPDANTGLRPSTSFLVEHARERVRLLAQRYGMYTPPSLPDLAFTQHSWPNMAQLIRQRPRLAARLATVINDERCISPDVFDVQYLNESLTAHLEGRADATRLLLVALTLGVWTERTLWRAI